MLEGSVPRGAASHGSFQAAGAACYRKVSRHCSPTSSSLLITLCCFFIRECVLREGHSAHCQLFRLCHSGARLQQHAGNRGPVPAPLCGKSPSSLQHTLTETAGQILLPWPPAPFKYHGRRWTRTEASGRKPGLGKLRAAPLEGKSHPQTEISPAIQVSSLPFCVMAELDSFRDRSPLSVPYRLPSESLLH